MKLMMVLKGLLESGIEKSNKLRTLRLVWREDGLASGELN
jgi:hypothetical protein